MNRLWKLALGLLAGCLLLSVTAVYAARLPNRDVCLQIENDTSMERAYQLLDLNSGRIATDPRIGSNHFWGSASPDGQSIAYVTQARGRTLNLYVRPASGGDSLLLRSDIALAGNTPDVQSLLRWSPDSRRLAYIWNDAQFTAWLTVVNRDGAGEQTVAFSRMSGSRVTTPQNTLIQGWSADGAYLAVSQGFLSGYSFWSTDPPQPIEVGAKTDRLVYGAWSPAGHRFAALTINNPQRLMLIAPGAAPIMVSLPEVVILAKLIWSPDGRYLTIAGQPAKCDGGIHCQQEWHFMVVNQEGHLINGIPAGHRILTSGNEVGSPVGRGIGGLWNAGRWLYLKLGNDENLLDLTALNPDSGEEETLVAGIVAGLADEVFYHSLSETYSSQTFDPTFLMPSGDRLLLPTWHNNKIRIELANLDGSGRIPVVDGADEIVDPRGVNSFTNSQFWSGDGQQVIIAWTTGKGDARRLHLTIVSTDGKLRFQDDDLIDVSYPQVAYLGKNNLPWYGYLAARADGVSLNIADMQHNQRYTLVNGLKLTDQWSIAMNPDNQRAAVVVRPVLATSFPGALYLASLNQPASTPVRQDVTAPPAWSPDGSQLAALVSKSGKYSVQLMTAEGTPTTRWALPPGQARADSWIYNWTTCD
jgi:Tol biopolymer transport system component